MSDYKTILVHADAGRTTPARLDIAVELAGALGAHLACLYAVRTEPIPSAAVEAREMLLEAQRRAREEDARTARQHYDECLRRTGFDKAEWRESAADPLEAVMLHARYADLVVIGQRNPEWPGGVDKDFERSLPIAVGRPVLVALRVRAAPGRAPGAGRLEREPRGGARSQRRAAAAQARGPRRRGGVRTVPLRRFARR
jgi:nucleotide-binding universal stress UspA family protein